MPNIWQRLQIAIKSFRLGPAVVDPSWEYWGKDTETFNPSSYGEFLATSVSVYSCVTLRSQNLASLPLCVYRTNKLGEKEKVTSGPLYDLLTRVNPFWTMRHLIEMTELALCLWGEAFWVLERGRGASGAPKEIWWASPDKMTPVPHPDKYLAGFIYRHNGVEIPFTTDEIVWFRYPNPIDEYEGLSPIASAKMSIELGMSGLKSNTNLFKNGMQLGGIISPENGDHFTKEQVVQLEALLSRRFKGVDKAHKWAVLSGGVKAQTVGVNPKDMEFIGQLRWSLGDVCRVYQIPPVLVQDLERSTYNNFDASLKTFWTLCLIPEASRIANWINEQLLPMFAERNSGYYVNFDLTEIDSLQDSKDAKWKRDMGQIAMGAITINEWRESQGLDPVPWGNEPNPLQKVVPGMIPGEPDEEIEPAGPADDIDEDPSDPLQGVKPEPKFISPVAVHAIATWVNGDANGNGSH